MAGFKQEGSRSAPETKRESSNVIKLILTFILVIWVSVKFRWQLSCGMWIGIAGRMDALDDEAAGRCRSKKLDLDQKSIELLEKAILEMVDAVMGAAIQFIDLGKKDLSIYPVG